MSSLWSLEFWVTPRFLENLFALNHFFVLFECKVLRVLHCQVVGTVTVV